MKTTPLVFIIHNNDDLKSANRVSLKSFFDKISIKVFFVSWQPEVPRNTNNAFFTLKDCFFSYLWQCRSLKRYEREVLKKNTLILTRFFSAFRDIYVGLKLTSSSIEFQKREYVKKIVTDKHIFAWRLGCELNADHIIVLEDDAILLKDSLNIISEALEFAENFESPLYIDLAGGFPESIVYPDSSMGVYQDGYRIIDGLITNTACGYMLNKSLARKLLDAHFTVSNLILPIDFMLNSLGVKAFKSSAISTCILPKLAFSHGSMIGSFESWQK